MELAESLIFPGIDAKTTAALQEILPSGYNYSMTSALLGDSSNVTATFQVNLFNEREVKEWLKCLEEKTYTTYKVGTTSSATGTLVNYKCHLNCQHKTRSRRKLSDQDRNMKNTSCPSKLIITIKAIHKRWQGKGKKPDPSLPCMIQLDFNHNHELQSAEMLRFRPVSEEVKAKMIEMYHKGHSPASALASHKIAIQWENEAYEHILADRKYCPDYGSCYRLYRKEFSKAYSDGDRAATLDILEKKAEDYNREAGSKCVIVKKVGNESIIAICTPLMKRVHKKVKQASEIVYVDSTRIADKSSGHRIFQIMTHNEVGGLPLGILIIGSETTTTVTAALQLLLELVGDEGFFCKGAIGPKLFTTNDCVVEKLSLSTIWPSAFLLFHVLQAFWRWLQNAKHGIPANERPALFYLFNDVVYTKTQDECVDRYNILIADKHAKKYPNYLKHVEDLWGRKKDWALYFRSEGHLPMTDSHVESSMKILKENILERVKAFTVVQLTDFILTRVDNYYKKKLLDAACNRCPKKSQRFPDVDPNAASGIKQISQKRFTVPSASATSPIAYTVDLSIGLCTCDAGSTGAMCKHQHWANLLFGGGATTVDSVTIRALCYEVATGKKPQWNWLDPLHDWCGHDVDMTAVKTEVEETAAQVDVEGMDAANSSDTSIFSQSISQSTYQSGDEYYFEPTEPQLYDQRARGVEAIENICGLLLGFLNDAPELIEPALQHAKAMLSKATTPESLVSMLMTLGNAHIEQQTSNPASTETSSRQSLRSKRKAPHNVSGCVVKMVRLDTTHSKQ